MNRRRFILGSAAAAASAAIGTAAWARWGEIHWVEFVEHDLPVRGLPQALVGHRVVQLSDLHIGPRVDDDFLVGTFARVRALEPEIVVYTGDFVTWRGLDQLAQLGRVMRHAPRGTRGTAAILGNHDYGFGWKQEIVADAITDRLHDLGIPVLSNSVVAVDGLSIAGVDDLWGPRFGSQVPDAAREGPSIVLCHNPDACDLDIWGNYDGWILSGHTHGGQVSLPFVGAPVLPVRNPRYVAGAYELDDGRQLYINRALGHALQVRFGVRPEVTVHRLLRT
jgi:predicted MPP superfamily phosphohydrolase